LWNLPQWQQGPDGAGNEMRQRDFVGKIDNIVRAAPATSELETLAWATGS